MEAFISLVLTASPTRFWGALSALVVITLGLFYLGFRQLNRARLIEDTPTSRIRSAAQGYVELEGRAVALGDPLYAPLSGRPCVWYQYRIDRRQSGIQGLKRWVSLKQGESLWFGGRHWPMRGRSGGGGDSPGTGTKLVWP